MTTPDDLVCELVNAQVCLSDSHPGPERESAKSRRNAARDAVLAALEGGVKAESEAADLRRKVYVPGLWKCPKCKFSLIQANLNGRDGTVTARDEPGDKCPNCDSPLWRVSEREAGNEMVDRAEECLARAVAAEAERDRLAAEVERLQKLVSGCRWYWPEDDTSEDCCRENPFEVCQDAGPGIVCGVSRGGIIETRYYAYLPAADDASSDDDFEIDEASESDARAKLNAEVTRRAALASTEPRHD